MGKRGHEPSTRHGPRVKDLGQSYAAHHELVANSCGKGRPHHERSRSKTSCGPSAPAKVFIEELVECATDSAKLLREAAEALVRTEPHAARPLLEKAAGDAKAAKREQAVRLLGRIYGGQAGAFLEKSKPRKKARPSRRRSPTACENSIAKQPHPRRLLNRRQASRSRSTRPLPRAARLPGKSLRRIQRLCGRT